MRRFIISCFLILTTASGFSKNLSEAGNFFGVDTNADAKLEEMAQVLNDKAKQQKQEKQDAQTDTLRQSVVDITVKHKYGIYKRKKIHCRGVIVKARGIFAYGIATHESCIGQLKEAQTDVLVDWFSYKMSISVKYADGSEKEIYASPNLNIPRSYSDTFGFDGRSSDDRTELNFYHIDNNIVVILPLAEDFPANVMAVKTGYFSDIKTLFDKTNGKLVFYADYRSSVKKYDKLSFHARTKTSKKLYTLESMNRERLKGDPVFYKGVLIGVNSRGKGALWYDTGHDLSYPWDCPLIQLFENGDVKF